MAGTQHRYSIIHTRQIGPPGWSAIEPVGISPGLLGETNVDFKGVWDYIGQRRRSCRPRLVLRLPLRCICNSGGVFDLHAIQGLLGSCHRDDIQGSRVTWPVGLGVGSTAGLGYVRR